MGGGGGGGGRGRDGHACKCHADVCRNITSLTSWLSLDLVHWFLLTSEDDINTPPPPPPQVQSFIGNAPQVYCTATNKHTWAHS